MAAGPTLMAAAATPWGGGSSSPKWAMPDCAATGVPSLRSRWVVVCRYGVFRGGRGRVKSCGALAVAPKTIIFSLSTPPMLVESRCHGFPSGRSDGRSSPPWWLSRVEETGLADGHAMMRLESVLLQRPSVGVERVQDASEGWRLRLLGARGEGAPSNSHAGAEKRRRVIRADQLCWQAAWKQPDGLLLAACLVRHERIGETTPPCCMLAGWANWILYTLNLTPHIHSHFVMLGSHGRPVAPKTKCTPHFSRGHPSPEDQYM